MQIPPFLESVFAAILSGFLALSGFLGFELSQDTAPPLRIPHISDQHTPLADAPTETATSSADAPTTTAQADTPPPAAGVPPRPAEPAEPASPVVENTAQSTEGRIARALVNVFCTYRNDDSVYTATGSGVFIDAKGVILTNAHVAQFLLLTLNENDFNAQCYIRTGNPATAQYQASLLYISPLWVRQNATLVDTPNPTGTGERDFALLHVTDAVRGALPSTFPAIALNITPRTDLNEGDTVHIGGYPAEILRDEGPDAALPPVITETTVTKAYTFTGTNVDIIGLASSTIGTSGSSGGPVVTEDGELIGLITTRGATSDVGTTLRALTLAYINRTLTEETGFSLSATLAGDLATRADIFNEALVPFLSELIEQEL